MADTGYFDSVSANLKTGVGAVSYTHLDVYKRQELRVLRKQFNRQKKSINRSFYRKVLARNPYLAQIFYCKTVSYTHLAVFFCSLLIGSIICSHNDICLDRNKNDQEQT